MSTNSSSLDDPNASSSTHSQPNQSNSTTTFNQSPHNTPLSMQTSTNTSTTTAFPQAQQLPLQFTPIQHYLLPPRQSLPEIQLPRPSTSSPDLYKNLLTQHPTLSQPFQQHGQNFLFSQQLESSHHSQQQQVHSQQPQQLQPVQQQQNQHILQPQHPINNDNSTSMRIQISPLPSYWYQIQFTGRHFYSFIEVFQQLQQSYQDLIRMIPLYLESNEIKKMEQFAWSNTLSIEDFNDKLSATGIDEQATLYRHVIRDKQCEFLTYYILICLNPQFAANLELHTLGLPSQFKDLILEIDTTHDSTGEIGPAYKINPSPKPLSLTINQSSSPIVINPNTKLTLSHFFLQSGLVFPTTTSGNIFPRLPIELIARSDLLPLSEIILLYSRIYELIQPLYDQSFKLQPPHTDPEITTIYQKYTKTNYTTPPTSQHRFLLRITYSNPHGLTKEELASLSEYDSISTISNRIRKTVCERCLPRAECLETSFAKRRSGNEFLICHFDPKVRINTTPHPHAPKLSKLPNTSNNNMNDNSEDDNEADSEDNYDDGNDNGNVQNHGTKVVQSLILTECILTHPMHVSLLPRHIQLPANSTKMKLSQTQGFCTFLSTLQIPTFAQLRSNSTKHRERAELTEAEIVDTFYYCRKNYTSLMDELIKDKNPQIQLNQLNMNSAIQNYNDMYNQDDSDSI